MNVSELAQHMGLSPTTVSRVLSGKAEAYRISTQTVERVSRAAERFQVAPDPLGAGLRRGTLGIIGLVVPDITNPFFAGLARAIELALRAHDMTVLLCDSAEDDATEIHLLNQMLGRRLDGMILAPVGSNSAAVSTAMQSAEFPIVLLDRILPEWDLPSVCIDNAEAGRVAARHLVEAGHRRIGCLRGDRDSFTDRERFRGVREVLGETDRPLDDRLVSGGGYSREAGLLGARRILDTGPVPTAVMTLSGQGILGLLQAVRERGHEIPRDVSIVAYDEQPWSAYMTPPLTTVVQPTERMAAETVRLVMQPKRGTQNVVLPAGLEVRESVRTLSDSVRIPGKRAKINKEA